MDSANDLSSEILRLAFGKLRAKCKSLASLESNFKALLPGHLSSHGEVHIYIWATAFEDRIDILQIPEFHTRALRHKSRKEAQGQGKTFAQSDL